MSIGIQTVRQRVRFAIISTVLFTGGVLSPYVASAATYYVATTGSDANPGSQSRPFQTIPYGVSVLKAGDTLYIRGGTYTNQRIGSTVAIPSGTSWNNPVFIAGYPGETVHLVGHAVGIGIHNGESYIIFDNLWIDANLDTGGIHIDAPAHHIRFQNGKVSHNTISGNGSFFEVLNSKVHNAFGYGWYWGGHDSVFEGNEVYDNAGYAFHIFSSGSSTVSNNIIRNNVIYGNGFGSQPGFNISGGVIISCGSNNKVYNNVMYNNYAGIQVDYRCTNCQVYNNTIYGSAETAGITIGSGAVNTIVRNNLVYGNRYNGIANDGDAGAVIDHNWTDSYSDPKFVNAAANDFHLQSTSPAIDTGITLSAVPTDLNGIPRPQGGLYDIGAYEYQVSSVPTPLPAPKNLRAISAVP